LSSYSKQFSDIYLDKFDHISIQHLYQALSQQSTTASAMPQAVIYAQAWCMGRYENNQCQPFYFCCILILRFWNVEILLHFYFTFSQWWTGI